MKKLKGATVLLVDDELHILKVLKFLLQDEGYAVETAETGEAALERCRKNEPDLVVLDLGLPGMDGLEVCRRLCEAEIPVLILSSHDEEQYVIAGLETGAMDYIRKPFNHRELILRVANLVDRGAVRRAACMSARGLTIDPEREELKRNDEVIHLTPTEYQLLYILMHRSGAVVSVEDILQYVWGAQEWDGARQLVKVNIQRLRQKIESDPHNPEYILNQWGRGYRFGPAVTIL